MNALNDILLENEKNPIEPKDSFREFHRENFKASRLITLIEMFGTLVSLSFFFFPRLVRSFIHPEEKILILMTWTPYNAEDYTGISNLIYLITWMLMNCKGLSCDTLFQNLILLHISQFSYLKCQFEKVFGENRSGLELLSYKENSQIERNVKWWIRQHDKTLK